MTLRRQFSLPILATLSVVIIATILAIGLIVSGMLRDGAVREMENLAEHQAAHTEVRLNTLAGELRGLALAARSRAVAPGDREAYLSALIRDLLEREPVFSAVWSMWEAGALHGGESRFNVCWIRGQSGFELQPFLESDYEGDFYLLPKASRQETFIEPYSYSYSGKAEEERLMTTIAIPLLDEEGNFLGVVGADLYLENLENIVEEIRPYGTGYAALLSTEGLAAAHPDADAAGKNIVDLEPAAGQMQTAISALASGTASSFSAASSRLGQRAFFELRPIELGQSERPWGLLLVAPYAGMTAQVRGLLIGTAIAGLLVLGLAFLVVLAASSRTTKEVLSLASAVRGMAAERDLGRDLPLPKSAELGDMARGLAAFLEELSGFVGEIGGSAAALSSGGAELKAAAEASATAATTIAQAAAELRRGASDQATKLADSSAASEQLVRSLERLGELIERQAAALAESSASVEEMTANVNSVAARARSLEETSLRLGRLAEDGGKLVEALAATAAELASRSQNLGEANGLIAGVAAKTNLLAMNAAIEAAHAGAAGAGFAVVADEIRALAEQSTRQSKAIAKDLREVQGLVARVAEEGDAAKEAFSRMNDDLVHVRELQRVIADAMAEQEAGNGQVLQAIAEIDAVTTEVREGSREMREAGNTMAEGLVAVGEIARTVHAEAEDISQKAQEVRDATARAAAEAERNLDLGKRLLERAGSYRTEARTDQAATAELPGSASREKAGQ